MTRVLGIDPGNKDSAFVLFDGRVIDHGFWGNDALRKRLRLRTFGDLPYTTVIEQMEGFGKPVGSEIFETIFWSGRFAEASRPFDRVTRKQVKRHLCGRTNVKDQDVRRALYERFGGFPQGFTGHKLSALAVAVTWWDRQPRDEAENSEAQGECRTTTV